MYIIPTCEFHPLMVRESYDVGKWWTTYTVVQTRTMHILSTWTASGYSTMHCSALYTVLTVIISSNYVADIRFALSEYCYSPLFLTVLVRTTYQLKIFACFPFLRTIVLPMFVEYRTRQVLNLARFVAPFLYITPLYMLSPYNCNILCHEVPEYF